MLWCVPTDKRKRDDMSKCSTDGCDNQGYVNFGTVDLPVGPFVSERVFVGGMPMSMGGFPVEDMRCAATETVEIWECRECYA